MKICGGNLLQDVRKSAVDFLGFFLL